MQATLRIGIADGQLAIQVDGKEIVMDLDQSLELFNAIGEVLEDFQEPFAGYGTVSVGWRLARWLVPRLQLDAHSPFFADTGWRALDDWGVALASGATVRLPGKFDLDVAVAEDVVVNTAPDVVFHVGLKRSL